MSQAPELERSGLGSPCTEGPGQRGRFTHQSAATVLVGLSFAVAMLHASCSAPGDLGTVMTSEPDLIGFVTEVELDGSQPGAGSIVVESHADKLVRRHRVVVTLETRIFELDGEHRRPSGFGNLIDLPGTRHRVKVWTKKPGTSRFGSTTVARQLVIVKGLQGD